MGITVRGQGGSRLHCEADQIVIRLPRQVFGTAWRALYTRLSEAIGQQQIIASPQRIMTERGAEEEAPHWKAIGLDVLSWLLFLFKVPADHELVALWQTIPWPTINQLCAPRYRNAHGGRPAWAPAQMVAILMLMFSVWRRLRDAHSGLAAGEHRLVLVLWLWLLWSLANRNALHDFRQRVGAQLFEQVLTLAVSACVEAKLVSNLLVAFDLTSVVASGHRWSPYERAVILTKALIRYLELWLAEQQPEEPMPDALRQLAASVALEVLPHKALDHIKPQRVVESVDQWADEVDGQKPPWQATIETAVEEVHVAERATEELSLAARPETVSATLSQVAKNLLARLLTRG